MSPIAKHTELEFVDAQLWHWSFGQLISSG